MKLTKRQLKKLIKEEKNKLLQESNGMGLGWGFDNWQSNRKPDFAKAYGSGAKTLGPTHQIRSLPTRTEQVGSGPPSSNSQTLRDGGAWKELQEMMHRVTDEMDNWMNKYSSDLETAGMLDDPSSVAVQVEDARLVLNNIRDEAYKLR